MKPVTSHIALTRTNGAPLSVNATVAAGEPVLVAGLSPSATPWDALAVFEWDKGGTAEAQTNAFTVMSAHILADIDLDGDCFTSNDVRRSLFPLPGDWAFPLSGTQRHAYLYFNFALPGHTTLSLDGPGNAFRAWTLYEGDPILPGNVRTNPYPYYADIEALAPGTGALTFSFHGTGVASNFNCSHTLPITAWDIAWPKGNTICRTNSVSWFTNGLTADNHFKILPESLDAEIYWSFDPADFPPGPETVITWEPWDVKNNRPHVGVGTNPKLKVTYEDPQSKYDDLMPPDNRWFGKKTLTVQVGDAAVTRPVWFFFSSSAKRTIRQDGKQEAAWYHYYRESDAVPLLVSLNFEFDPSMASAGQYRPWPADSFHLGFSGAAAAMKPVFDVNVYNSYTQEKYPYPEGRGVHAVAQNCWHEYWHRLLMKETWPNRWPWWGLGHSDDDGDGLSNAREVELGTKINQRDTCGLANYVSGEIIYSGYASYADQELFCRWKQDGILGDASKDWSLDGAQGPP